MTNPGEGNGNLLQYSCLENSMDRGAWWATVHGVTKSRRRLSDFTLTFHVPALEKEMATHSSVLACRIPGTGEPGGLPSVGSHRVGHDWSDLVVVVVVYLFSSGSSWVRNQTRVSWISCGFFTNWAIREANLSNCSHYSKVFGHMSVEGNSNQEGWGMNELWAKRYSASTQMARTKGFSFGCSQGEGIFLFPAWPLPFLH